MIARTAANVAMQRKVNLIVTKSVISTTLLLLHRQADAGKLNSHYTAAILKLPSLSLHTISDAATIPKAYPYLAHASTVVN
jgi:hypothetical protein